jgi:hypothetical protein
MISPQILKRIKYVLKSRQISKGKGKHRKVYQLSTELENFLNTINTTDTLKSYLHLEYDGLRCKINWFENNLRSAIFRPSKKNQVSNDANYLILYSIFVDHGYSYENFNKLNFIEKLNIDTCPYCNRNYIYALSKKGQIKPEIDHFFPKGIYPFLGASFYNLVPSCQTCNGFGGKGSEDTYRLDVKSPYEIKEGELHFTFVPADLDFLNPLRAKGTIEIKLDKKHDPNADLFKLNELYLKHEDHVLELIVKSEFEYSKEYRKKLQDFDKYALSPEEIDRMIIGNYNRADDLQKRPLSKLYRDIAIELGLISSSEH